MEALSFAKEKITDESLTGLLDALHDRWFDMARVRFDTKAEVVTIHFAASKRGPFDRELLVTHVSSLDVKDDAGIGLYDVDAIQVDEVNSQIVITSGFPLRLAMHVRDEWRLTCHDIS